MMLDRWGYEVNTASASSSSCISSINSYYHQVLSYGRKRDVIMEAVDADPNCVLANILAALFCSSHDPSRVPSLVHAATSHLGKATPYEKAVFETINCMLSPNRDDEVAVELHSKLLKEFPKDLVSLKRAQVLCFYMGRADLSLQLVQQVLPSNNQQDFVYGMLAFPLLELGRMEDAEKAAKKGFQINKEDPWSQHALCHVYQYECRFKEAVEFMEECSKSWGPLSSFMNTHNWWHVALCYLEGNAPFEKVCEIYENRIWKELDRIDASPVEVYLNAVGLLLRVHVRGKIHFFEDYLKMLAGYLSDRAFWYLEWHLDLLTLWAFACTGKTLEARDLLEGLESKVSMMNPKKRKLMKKGLTLAEAAYEYGRGDFTRALELLGPDFDAESCKMVGASGEQLDVFNEVWYVMLLDAGDAKKAIEVIEKQLKKRSGTPFLWRLLGILDVGEARSRKYRWRSLNEKSKSVGASRTLKNPIFYAKRIGNFVKINTTSEKSGGAGAPTVDDVYIGYRSMKRQNMVSKPSPITYPVDNLSLVPFLFRPAVSNLSPNHSGHRKQALQLLGRSIQHSLQSLSGQCTHRSKAAASCYEQEW
ncbi:putative tetratricopeptide repeat protein [Helianthus debilis subsp. tardiflorus]